jgi:hypothetical protein
MTGYLEGYASGQKCGSEIMKMKACREFSKILADICPHFTKDDIDALETVFRKDLEE